jgi:hypothetical protein
MWEKPRASGNLIRQQDGIVSAGSFQSMCGEPYNSLGSLKEGGDLKKKLFLCQILQWRSFQPDFGCSSG